MTDIMPISAESTMILAELRSLRDEMQSMHQETHAALLAIREMVDELHGVERRESNIEQGLEDMAQQLGEVLDGPGPSLTTCSVCGSDVERHGAENGILLICKACGHTAFAERRTNGERRQGAERRSIGQSVADAAPEPTRESFDWTSAST
ncbi:hypothetical protein CCC_02290 [Paramagnetospirillum magnetotacticum MS-1]|uniref:Uncharacterized protein n=1 Tax=Paramagnetospirillum magnetotacticum MS-1 TaxID=272627 RepID=A0A0C2YVV2_PARME|nr:hypothetical protein [Paramagnetospirillum magnetotacticum]KIL98840.1 hypothetical protein CCC_02290 [Paramagnetospirillum magnetotacticum MS-1]